MNAAYATQSSEALYDSGSPIELFLLQVRDGPYTVYVRLATMRLSRKSVGCSSEVNGAELDGSFLESRLLGRNSGVCIFFTVISILPSEHTHEAPKTKNH